MGKRNFTKNLKKKFSKDRNPTDESVLLSKLQQEIEDLKNKLIETQQSGVENKKTLARIENIVSSNHDNLPFLRDKLLAVRQTKQYGEVFKKKQPLISIRIATHNRADDLLSRTIPSILKQTYKNWEVIIVGDHSTDDTEQRLEKLNDPRIKFINEPFGFPYPEDPLYRWMVAGATVMNTAAQMAQGDWIAPIDDDDEFTPDHLEVLLETALQGKYEMVYGKVIQHNLKTKKEIDVWSYPPQKAQVAAQGMLYLRQLNFFEYDIKSWVVEEVGDWNFFRRMLESGVKVGATEKTVAKLYYEPKF